MSKHRTARGREFNMQAFSSDRGETIAVGNSGRNARGDLLGPGGKVIATKQQIAAQVHNNTTTRREGKQVKLNPMEQEISRKEVIGVDGVRRWEVAYADGSIEMVVKEENDTSASLNEESTEESTETLDLDTLLKSYKEE